jgi:hypothetical protein
MKFIPQAREIAHKADEAGKKAESAAVEATIEAILKRPEHQWYERDLKAMRANAPK